MTDDSTRWYSLLRSSSDSQIDESGIRRLRETEFISELREEIKGRLRRKESLPNASLMEEAQRMWFEKFFSQPDDSLRPIISAILVDEGVSYSDQLHSNRPEIDFLALPGEKIERAEVCERCGRTDGVIEAYLSPESHPSGVREDVSIRKGGYARFLRVGGRVRMLKGGLARVVRYRVPSGPTGLCKRCVWRLNLLVFFRYVGMAAIFGPLAVGCGWLLSTHTNEVVGLIGLLLFGCFALISFAGIIDCLWPIVLAAVAWRSPLVRKKFGGDAQRAHFYGVSQEACIFGDADEIPDEDSK